MTIFGFWSLSKKFSVYLWKFFLQVCQSRILPVQGNFLRNKTFVKKNKFRSLFVLWAKEFRTFCGKNFASDVKTVFCVSRGTFWRKRFFLKKKLILLLLSDFGRKRFRFFAEKFRQGCQNCILRVHRNFFKKEKLLKKILKKYFFSEFERKCFRISAKSLVTRSCLILNLDVFTIKNVVLDLNLHLDHRIFHHVELITISNGRILAIEQSLQNSLWGQWFSWKNSKGFSFLKKKQGFDGTNYPLLVSSKDICLKFFDNYRTDSAHKAQVPTSEPNDTNTDRSDQWISLHRLLNLNP